MANRFEPNDEQVLAWQEFLDGLPQYVRDVAENLPPWKLYRMDNHRVFPISFGETEDERVELTVAVLGDYNWVAMERQVFGVDPANLTECDLPGPDEQLGCWAKETAEETGMPIEEVEQFVIDEFRAGGIKP